MDQIFDRFERLFKSWVSPDEASPSDRAGKRSGDSDFDSAMDELDDFLSAAKGDDEAAKRERERRRAAEEARARASSGGAAASQSNNSRDPRLVAAYEYLGLPYGTPIEEVKAKYKKLLLKHHPDRHAGSPANIKKATETSARINESWRIIESWATTGRVTD
ncbi:MAG TPA: DnaJ domain-containing protein [Rectinemataceae bacterium]|nr:DnaJ domain-containing protein [Rectinemataceae bacterium]